MIQTNFIKSGHQYSVRYERADHEDVVTCEVPRYPKFCRYAVVYRVHEPKADFSPCLESGLVGVAKSKVGVRVVRLVRYRVKLGSTRTPFC